MDYIHSNSQESLLSIKIRDITRNDITTKEIMDYVKNTCEKRSLDIEKVSGEIVTALDKAKEIRYVSAFVKAVVARLDVNAFKKDVKKPLFTSLNKALDQNGITGETWELFLIHAIETHCLNEFHTNVNDFVTTNHAIIEYCKNNDIHTLKEFTDLLLKSKLVKGCNVPIVVLTAEAKENGQKYDELVKDLREDESLYGESEDIGTLC